MLSLAVLRSRLLLLNTTNSNNIGKVSSVVIHSEPFITNPGYRAVMAFIISLVVVLVIFYASFLIIRKINVHKQIDIKLKFWDIIRDNNWYPSLAIFQFLLWTGIILFAYLGIALMRVFSKVGPFVELPNTLVLVMGISAASSSYRSGDI